jgi:hypothetical protein
MEKNKKVGESSNVKILSKKDLSRLLKNLIEKSEDNAGYYKYKDITISIHFTASYRNRKNAKKRKAKGLCVTCGKKITRINPVTKELFKRCELHRKLDCLRTKLSNKERKGASSEEMEKIKKQISQLIELENKNTEKKEKKTKHKKKDN